MSIQRVAILAAFSITFGACGSGKDPFASLGDPNAKFVDTLALPYNAATGSATGGPISLTAYTPFSASEAVYDGIDFSFSVQGTYQALAPAAGVVSQADSASVTILHNIHVSSRLSKLSTVTVRVGDSVQAGSVVGSTAISSTPNAVISHLSVLVDGAVVCPYSFLAASAKKALNVVTPAGSGPCRE